MPCSPPEHSSSEIVNRPNVRKNRPQGDMKFYAWPGGIGRNCLRECREIQQDSFVGSWYVSEHIIFSFDAITHRKAWVATEIEKPCNCTNASNWPSLVQSLVFRGRSWVLIVTFGIRSCMENRKDTPKGQSFPCWGVLLLNGALTPKPTFTSLLSIILDIPTYFRTANTLRGTLSKADLHLLFIPTRARIFVSFVILLSMRRSTNYIVSTMMFITFVLNHQSTYQIWWPLQRHHLWPLSALKMSPFNLHYAILITHHQLYRIVDMLLNSSLLKWRFRTSIRNWICLSLLSICHGTMERCVGASHWLAL